MRKTGKRIAVLSAAVAAAAVLTTMAAFAEEKGTIKVAASPTPHAEILEQARPILEEQGWKLEVIEFEDYVQPNLVVDSGEIDANYFQHVPYLDNFNEETIRDYKDKTNSRKNGQISFDLDNNK